MEELRWKIAEWLGFRWQKADVIKTVLTSKGVVPVTKQEGWVRPDGSMGHTPDTLFHLPDFPTSLDACFEYIVPERISEITFMYASNCASCDIEDLEGNFFEGHVNTDNIEEAWKKSALAFCLAVEKLIDGGNR